jgi:tetratricopeptide (TPR) repeat protein
LADPLMNLAILYTAERRFAESAPLYLRALPLRERVLGADHSKLAEALENYAVVMRKLEEYAEAEKAQVRATRIRVRTALRAESESGQ